MTEPHARANRRIGERDAALRRLRRLTALALAGAGTLAALFAGLAAKAFSGHTGTTTHRTVVQAASTPAKAVATPPPPLVANGSASTATPSSPSQSPVQTQAPPVAVSGGS